MSNSYSLDLAAKCIKRIVDNIRCMICDRIDEGRSRYGCGHTACSACIQTAQSCLLCLTPQRFEKNCADVPLTRRAKHAIELLNAFQTTFHLDVFRQQRISEQLKLEKSMFPQCIQAPQTYSNKRRSSKSVRGRDSHCILPGEIVTAPRMENSRKFVQEWLESNENEFSKLQPRLALSELKVNSPRPNHSPTKKRADMTLGKKGPEYKQSSTKSRKRSIQTAFMGAKSQSGLDKYMTSTGARRNAKEVRKEFEQHEKTISHDKSDKDESGIVMDDEPIVIEDSQSQYVEPSVIEDSQIRYVDKDREALLAVLKASENESDRLSQETTTTQDKTPAAVESSLTQMDKIITANEKKSKRRIKVPFYKRSSFLTPLDINYKKDLPQRDPIIHRGKYASITVETKTFVTTIQVYNCPKPNITKKVSKSVQTDLEEDVVDNCIEKKDKTTEMSPEKAELCTVTTQKSRDLFTGAPNKNAPETVIPAENISFPAFESSSDSEHEHSSLLVATADIHHCRESDDLHRGILTEVQEAVSSRPAKRYQSPVSSNSSNKENHNPNARRSQRNEKKRKKSKE